SERLDRSIQSCFFLLAPSRRDMEIDDHVLDVMALPPLTPTMERVFSEALSEMEKRDEPTVAMHQDWIKGRHEETRLRLATPPPATSLEVGGISPSVKNPATSKDSAEVKRARRSAIEKKSRQRRQEMLKRMRHEVQQLQDVYTEMARRREASSINARSDTHRPFSSISMDDLQRKYSELSLVAHALEEDQVALRALVQTHEKFHQALQSLSDGREAENEIWNSGIPPSSSFSVRFRHHSNDECFAIVREAYQEIGRFLEADNFQSTGASFMGWTDKRKVDQELQTLQFCFTKKFPLESAENLLTRTWDIFSSGHKMAEMSFDRSVRTRFEVLQVLSDNLIIIRRDHVIPSMPMTFFSVQMIFRLQTPTGYTMCSRTISAPEIENAMEPHEYFYNAFHWTRFNHLYDELGNVAGCEIVAVFLLVSARIDVSPKPLHQSKPPFSPTTERDFSEAAVETCIDFSVVVKLETTTKQENPGSEEHVSSMNVRFATPPPSGVSSSTYQTEVGSMSPSEKSPASFTDPAEAKRARRSAIEKKSRQRRQRILKHMREEVKQLENIYAEMAKRKETGIPVDLVRWGGLGDVNTADVKTLHQKYSELSLVAHSLEQDQVVLQKLLQEHENFNQTVNSLSDDRRAEGAFAIWDSGVPPSSSFAARLRPLSMAEGYALVRESYDEIRKFTESETFDSTGASVMGWTDKREFDQNSQAFQYSFTKHFPFENTEHVFAKSWDTFLDGPKLENLAFDGSAQSRFEVLQVLNNDLLVIRRDHRMPSFPMTFTSVQILFRLQSPTGYTLCIRSISSPEIKSALEPHEYLFDVFHWTHFNRLYNEYDEPAGCEIVTAGSINDHSRLKSNYWLFEIVCSVLRWESLTIAPVFLIPPE
ncbi:hypothetical protein JG687_00014709, partial [Phytophthora cactorum]